MKGIGVGGGGQGGFWHVRWQIGCHVALVASQHTVAGAKGGSIKPEPRYTTRTFTGEGRRLSRPDAPGVEITENEKEVGEEW